MGMSAQLLCKMQLIIQEGETSLFVYSMIQRRMQHATLYMQGSIVQVAKIRWLHVCLFTGLCQWQNFKLQGREQLVLINKYYKLLRHAKSVVGKDRHAQNTEKKQRKPSKTLWLIGNVIAFGAKDPGSNLGRNVFLFFFLCITILANIKPTSYLLFPNQSPWCSG